MKENSPSDQEDTPNEFERLSEHKQQSLLLEFWQFLTENKKWWLIPLLIALAIYAVFLIVSISNGPVFIYKFF